MITKSYENVKLSCTMQENELTPNACTSGILSLNPTDGSFRFVESVRTTKTPARNLKLFSGERISFVRMCNGLYQPHVRTINASEVTNPEGLAFEIYLELVEAFKAMK